MCHGWPGTIWEMLPAVTALSDPAAHGGDAADAFDVVVPSIPGFGFSGAPAEGTDVVRTAELWAALMDRLGYERFGAYGSDWGAAITRVLGASYPERLVGVHTPGAPPRLEREPETDAERDYAARAERWSVEETGYQRIQGTKPQTLAFGLTDSPVGLAAWITEKLRSWSDCNGDVESRFSKDQILTLVSIYWHTRTIGTSVRYYHANGLGGARPRRRAPGPVRVPQGFAQFVGIPLRGQPPRSFVGEPAGNRLQVDYQASALLKEAGLGLWRWLRFDLLLIRWSSLAFPLQLFLAAAALLPIGYAFVRERGDHRARLAWRPFHLFGGFALAYLGALLASLMLGAAANKGLLPRFLTPAYIPLLIAGAVGLDRFLGLERARLRERSRRHPSRAGEGAWNAWPGLPAASLMLVLSLWAAGQVALNLKQIGRANASDLRRDFSALPWTESETLRYIRQHPFSGESYSNLAFLTYLHADGAGTHAEMPRDRPGGIAGAANAHSASGRERLQAWLADAADGAIIHWFKDVGANMAYDYGAAEMRATPGLALVAELDDGFIFRVRKAEALRARHPSAYAAMTAAALGAPAARAFFDLHLAGTALAYRKQPCAAADWAARFFLHLAPAKVEDLPAHRRRHGFDNLDFDFPQRGAVVEGACLAIVQLPDYDILRIKTGQFVRGAGELWQAQIELP